MIEEAALKISLCIEAEARINRSNFADGSFTDDLENLRGLRMTAIMKRLHKKNPVLARRLYDGHGFGMIHSERFLTKNVFATLCRTDGPLSVKKVRRGNVDGLKFR